MGKKKIKIKEEEEEGQKKPAKRMTSYKKETRVVDVADDAGKMQETRRWAVGLAVVCWR